MARADIATSAVATGRSLSEAAMNAADRPSRELRADPVLLCWRRLMDNAVRDAKRTRNGLPTGLAHLARWWIVEYRPPQSDRDGWATSFEACCSWLGIDAATERERLRSMIDAAWQSARDAHWTRRVYECRAAVMACAGEPAAIRGQFYLPLVDEDDYREVSMVEDDEPQLTLLRLA